MTASSKEKFYNERSGKFNLGRKFINQARKGVNHTLCLNVSSKIGLKEV